MNDGQYHSTSGDRGLDRTIDTLRKKVKDIQNSFLDAGNVVKEAQPTVLNTFPTNPPATKQGVETATVDETTTPPFLATRIRFDQAFGATVTQNGDYADIKVPNVSTGTGTFTGNVDFQGDAKVAGAGKNLGFFGVGPVAQAAALTQTYATTTRTFSAYTANNQSSAYTGIDNAQAGTPYATVADLNTLRTAYENLRAFVENIGQLLNSVIDDLQAYGLEQ